MKKKPEAKEPDPNYLIATGCSDISGMNGAYEEIHPNMPAGYQDRLAVLCDAWGISFWDRGKVYDHLKSLGRELALRREW